MVTRVYCDHCGNAARNAKKFVYGAHTYFFGGIEDPTHTHTISQQMQNASPVHQSTGAFVGGQQAQALNPNSLPAYKPTIERPLYGSVDLCDTCQVVWMNRVKALTQASEP